MPTAETTEEVRHYLHKNPEVSGEEIQTSKFLREYIFAKFPGYQITKGSKSQGFVATKTYGEGAHVAFRAELDALPILEENVFEHKSKVEGKSHACGHDGHMSILLATLNSLEESEAAVGSASFLFQPAEETGRGAQEMLEDEAFANFGPDALIALHNIPGMAMGLVLSREGTFACGSVGVRLTIRGKTAHAAHPEDAVNPLLLAKNLLEEILQMPQKTKGFALATPIALHSGKDTFGISPLESSLLITLRAAEVDDLDSMMRGTERLVAEVNKIDGAKASLSFEEFFPITANDHFHGDLREICTRLKRPFEEMKDPFRWSEDFGHYSKRFRTQMFGLGSGKNTAPLHASTYDFPNELIDFGAKIFVEFYHHMNKK